MEIMARKDEVNGEKEGQYRETSLEFFWYLSCLHPHLYLKDHNKNLSNQESKWPQHSHINVCNVTVNEIKFFLLFRTQNLLFHMLFSVQFSTVTRSCLTLCDPMDCSMPGFPVHHQLPELTQTHVLRVGDAIQLSHPLPSPSPPTFNLA